MWREEREKEEEGQQVENKKHTKSHSEIMLCWNYLWLEFIVSTQLRPLQSTNKICCRSISAYKGRNWRGPRSGIGNVRGFMQINKSQDKAKTRILTFKNTGRSLGRGGKMKGKILTNPEVPAVRNPATSSHLTVAKDSQLKRNIPILKWYLKTLLT